MNSSQIFHIARKSADKSKKRIVKDGYVPDIGEAIVHIIAKIRAFFTFGRGHY